MPGAPDLRRSGHSVERLAEGTVAATHRHLPGRARHAAAAGCGRMRSAAARVRTRSSRRLDRNGLSLETIACVSGSTPCSLPRARQRIGGQEERSPSFVLAHVDVLVRTERAQRCRVDADDDVPEGHRAEANRTRKAGDEASHETAAKLDDARDAPDAATQAQHRETDEYTEQRVRRRPRAGEQARCDATCAQRRSHVRPTRTGPASIYSGCAAVRRGPGNSAPAHTPSTMRISRSAPSPSAASAA